MFYTVYEVFPDGKKFFRFESDDLAECVAYVREHWYDHKYSTLIIEKSSELQSIEDEWHRKADNKAKRAKVVKTIIREFFFGGVLVMFVWITYEFIRQLFELI